MSMGFYKFAYRVGFTPWEGAAEQEPVAQQVSTWFAREESGREPPTERLSTSATAPGETQ
jgi:hypothetical protein